ncbi:MAG: tetratricopeptide repeat protein [candidate division NC10 bacterium]
MLRIRISILAGISILMVAPGAAAFHTAPEVRAGMLRAADLILNLDVDAAETECQALLTLPQGEAAGKFCLGLVTLTRAEDKDDPNPDLDRFLAQAADAVAAAETLERSQPTDAEVKLLLGLVHGSKALADGARKNYLAAFQSLREAHRRFQEALQLDPNLVDAYYGIGLYNFSLGRLPALLKPLVTIVLPRGDPAHGLQELDRVAEQGTSLKMTARVALLRLYAGPEEKYAEALRLGRDLLQQYPGNPDLYFTTAHAASELGRTGEALEIARRLSRNMAEGRPHFIPELSPRYNQLMGKIYMDHGEYATALTFFQRAVQAPTPARYRWVTAWAWTRSGMIHDLQGDREEAVRRYRKALGVETEGIAKDLARRHLETPYRGRARPAS